jgi:hypothetical protein
VNPTTRGWGLLHWADIRGDPVAADWVRRYGERLAGLRLDLEQADARTMAVFLHMMCQFYLHTGVPTYLEAGRPAVAAFRKRQNPNGSWPAYLANQKTAAHGRLRRAHRDSAGGLLRHPPRRRGA